MLKKSLILVTIFSVLVISLVACRRESEPEYEPMITPEMPIIDIDYDYYNSDYGYYNNNYGNNNYDFTIDRIDEADIAELGDYNEFSYSDEPGENLLIRFNNPVTNFNLLGLDSDEYGTIITANRIHALGDVGPDQPLLIRNYRWSGVSFPRQGFTFTGANGENKYHRWDVSAMDGELRWERFDWKNH